MSSMMLTLSHPHTTTLRRKAMLVDGAPRLIDFTIDLKRAS